jgi:predicted metal-dependent hydrolase
LIEGRNGSRTYAGGFSGGSEPNPDVIRAPTRCIDYVIPQELVHLIHPDHDAAFYDLLETVMTDWKKRKE